MSGCPIVFFNTGIQEHLLYSLTQARRLNPASPVLLFCDGKLPEQFNFIEQIPIPDYSASARDFAPLYRHFSDNAPFNELLCIQRWFVFRDYFRTHPYDRIFHLDSDVLLFCCVDNARPFFDRYDFAFSGISGHTSFLTLPVIEELCELFIGYYSGSNSAIVEKFEADKKKYAPDGPTPKFNISDMSFLKYYLETTKRPNVDISTVHRGLSGPFFFDHNINVSDIGFKMGEHSKLIEWVDGAPYGTLEATGEKIRFCSMHFQGPGKPLVPEAFDKTGNASASWRP